MIELTDLDIYIIPDHQPLYVRHRTRRKGLHPALFRFSWRDFARMLAVLTAATAVCFAFDSAGFSESNSITVYILGVLVTAVWTEGYGYGAMASLLSVAAFNFFLRCRGLPFRQTTPATR